MAAEALTDRIAIISDVHGNLTALETVLAHIEDAGITRILETSSAKVRARRKY